MNAQAFARRCLIVSKLLADDETSNRWAAAAGALEDHAFGITSVADQPVAVQSTIEEAMGIASIRKD